MKKIFNIFLLTAALTIAWGCSSTEDDAIQPKQGTGSNSKVPDSTKVDSISYKFTLTAEQPTWTVDWTWNDEAPDWQSPEDASVFESRMYVCLTLGYDLLPYASEDDKVALFVGEECRGVTSPYYASDYSIYFNVIVLGDHKDSERKMTIKYYCAKMKQIFTLDGFYTFLPEVTLGDNYDLELKLGDGSPKYSYSFLTVRMYSAAPLTSSYNDVLGVFINGECRGVGHLNEKFKVWIDKDVEQVDASTIELRYYNVEKGGYYTIPFTENLELLNYHEMWIFVKK